MNQIKPITLKSLAELIGARLEGDPECLIDSIASLENAKKGQLSFLSNSQYRKFLLATEASAVIVSPEDAGICPVYSLISTNPRLSLVKVVQLFEKKEDLKPEIHPSVVIGKGCEIPASVTIGAYSVIGDEVSLGEKVVIGPGCVIGNNCHIQSGTTLKARVNLYDKVRIGKQCLIHSGVVMGSDGFGFANESGNWVKMPHLGGVSVGDKVEIGANTSIDRGFLEDTIIGDGVIIDNLVQIGHNVSIGDRTAIAGCVGIAGSTNIGKSCLIGGASSIGGHLQIADGVHITATSSVNHSLSKGVYSSGFPAKPAHLWRKNMARFNFLDDMAKRLRSVEQALTEELSHLPVTEVE